jgi:MMPL family
MILVFGSFLLGGQRVLQEFGFGLGFAVLVDALVIRGLLVPALMHLTGPPTGPSPAGWTASCPVWPSKPGMGPQQPSGRRQGPGKTR